MAASASARAPLKSSLSNPGVTTVDVRRGRVRGEAYGLAGVADLPPVFFGSGMGEAAHPRGLRRSRFARDGRAEVGDRPVARHHITPTGPAPRAPVRDQSEPVAPHLLDPIGEELVPRVDDPA